jgi:hypothetical protein
MNESLASRGRLWGVADYWFWLFEPPCSPPGTSSESVLAGGPLCWPEFDAAPPALVDEPEPEPDPLPDDLDEEPDPPSETATGCAWCLTRWRARRRSRGQSAR